MCFVRWRLWTVGSVCWRYVLDVLDVPEGIRCVLLCMLEAVDGGLCLLELRVLDVLDVPEVTRCVLLCMLEAVEGELSLGGFETPSTPTDRETTDGGELEDAGGRIHPFYGGIAQLVAVVKLEEMRVE